ncbi:MAG: LapA family protein [Syntrophorhabdaceae bacterium]|nr:LapA family protein [Syntrophorhabdaceae bacterium]MDD5245114.1 LapA family protein [Syntrophorhabdaceae bacterium]
MSALVLIIILLAIVTIFSVQNAAIVTISFIFWKFEASLAIVIFLSVLLGVIVGSIIVLSIRASKKKQIDTGNTTKDNMGAST